MAVSKAVERWAFQASEDLSTKQFRAVVLSTTGTISLATSATVTSASGIPFILEDTPKNEQYGTVVLVGVSKVKVLAEVKAGERVAVVGVNGECGPAKGTELPVLGVALATANAGTLCTVLVHSGSGAIGQ